MIREIVSIRIVHVAPTTFGAEGLFGGGERYPLELARAVAAEGRAQGGIDCELVTFGPRSGVTREPSGLRVRVMRAFGHRHGHPAHPLAPGLPLALSGADVVHVHQMRSAPGQVAAAAARVAGKALVVTDHGLGGGGWGGLLPRLFDGFLTVSAYSARTLAAPPAKTRVIGGGADVERFRPEPREPRQGVLFVGRFTPHKGLDRLIRALPAGAALTAVGTWGHDPHLPERGYPSLLRRLAAAADAHVTFAGRVADEDLPGYYRRAAVVVLPSVERTCYGRRVAISELLGLSLLEAMASGTPVIASRLGGIPEVVADGETGFLVTPGDRGELHDRVALLLADGGLAAEMGARARQVVLDRFTWPACARACLDAYRELAGPDRRRRRGGLGGQATGAR